MQGDKKRRGYAQKQAHRRKPERKARGLAVTGTKQSYRQRHSHTKKQYADKRERHYRIAEK